MEKKTAVMLTFLVLILLIGALYVFTDWFSKVTGFILGEDEKTKLAHCLKEHDAQFFGSQNCAECVRQQDLFGSSWRFINAIDCGPNKEQCPHIKEIPAWYVNKNVIYGFRNITELKKISNCTQ